MPESQEVNSCDRSAFHLQVKVSEQWAQQVARKSNLLAVMDLESQATACVEWAIQLNLSFFFLFFGGAGGDVMAKIQQHKANNLWTQHTRHILGWICNYAPFFCLLKDSYVQDQDAFIWSGVYTKKAQVKSIRPPSVSPCWLHSFTQIHYLMREKRGRKQTLTSVGPDRRRATARPGARAVWHWRIDKSNYNVHNSVPALHNSKAWPWATARPVTPFQQ